MPKFIIVMVRQVRRVYSDIAPLTIEAENLVQALQEAQRVAWEPRTEGVDWQFDDGDLVSEKVLSVEAHDIDNQKWEIASTSKGARLVPHEELDED
jgi:hypothetical protein